MDFLNQYQDIIIGIGIISSLSFVLSLLIIPIAVCRLDSSFFLHIHDPKVSKDEHPLVFILLKTFRYSVGGILLLAGILMLFLPGQGILTMILGASLLDFPGKKPAIDSVLRRQSVQKSLNWLREKGNKPPFSFSDSSS